MTWFKKSSSLRDTSALGMMWCLLSPAYGLQETYESRNLIVSQGLNTGYVDSINLQQQALLATTALNGNTSTNTVVTLPQSVAEVKSNLGLATSTPVTQYVESLRNAVGGSSGGIFENAQAINAALDGVQSLSGLVSFVVSTPASHTSNTVSIIGDDGAAGQTYSFTYSSPILSGASITLSNGGKSITFINNSGVTLSSASDLATYLAGAYPLNFMIANNTTTKISAISDLLGGASGGSSGTNTSLYGQAITALSSGPTNDVVNNILDGIQSMSGLATFTVTSAAINGGGTVSLDGNDGTPSQTYGVIPTLPITSGSTFSLSNGGKIITFVNNSGGSLTTANDLASYLADAYPINAILKGDTNGKAAALENVIGGSNYSAMSNAIALDNMLLITPTGVLRTDVQSVNSAIDGNATGATVKSRLNTIFGNIDGSNGSSGNITTKLTSQITSLEGSATQLSTAISHVNGNLDGVQSLSGATSFTVSTAANNSSGTVSIVGNDGTPGRIYSVVPTLPITSGSTFTLTHSGSGNTITFLNNSGGSIASAANLASYLASAYPVNAVVKNTTNTKATALGTVIGGSNGSAMSNAIALDALLLTAPIGVLLTDVQSLNSAIDGNASGSTVQGRLNTVFGKIDGSNGTSGNITTKLTSQITSLEGSATQLSTAISSVNTRIGGSGTTSARVNNVNSNLDGVQSMSGLSSFTVGTAASNSSGTVTIIGNDGTPGRSYSVDTSPSGINLGDGTGGTTSISSGGTITLTHSGSGNTITFVNNSGGSITSTVDLTSYLESAYPVSIVLKGSANTKVTTLENILGGQNYHAMANATVLIGNIDGSASSIQDGLNNLSTVMVGNTNFSSSLTSQLTSQSDSLDSGVVSLPNGSLYGGINSAASSDGSGGVNIGVGSGFGSASGTYNLSSGTISGGINNNASFTLDNNGDSLVLRNQSGSTINNQSQALRYLQSRYPVGSKFTTILSDKVNNLNLEIGGTVTGVNSRLAAFDARLLDTPTGILSTDLSTLRGRVVSTPGITAETDVNSVLSMIDGSSSGVLETKLGTPTINSISSNLATVVGGSGDLAQRLGDPVTAGTGLSSLIKASSATDTNSLWNGGVGGFTNATDLNNQLQQFLALFNTNNWTNTGNTTITFTCSGSTPSSIADLINMATSTS